MNRLRELIGAVSSLHTFGALIALMLLGNDAGAGDYDHGPTWDYRKSEGTRSFGDKVYSNGKDGYPVATPRFRDLGRGDVKRFGVTAHYSAYVVPATGNYVLVWHYHERGEDEGMGVYRVLFADGERLTRYNVPGPGKGLKFLEELPALKSLGLAHLELDESDLKYLRGLSRLESLSLARSKRTEELARWVNKDLKSLQLPYSDLTDAGLARLAELKKLEVLDLSGTAITAAGLKHLTALEHLRELTLREVGVSAEEMEAIAKKLPRGIRLNWSPGRSRAEKDALAVLGRTNYFPDFSPGFVPFEQTQPVTEICFMPRPAPGRAIDPKLSPEVIDALLALKHLETLQIGGPELTDKHLERLAALPKLEFLWIKNASQVTDAGLAHLKAWPALRRLDLQNIFDSDDVVPRVTIGGLAHLAGIAKLDELWMQGPQFTDEAVPHLARLKSLRVLVLDRTGITKQGYEKLRQALPKTGFSYYPRREPASRR
jgi:hypothetical protein